MRDVLWSSSQFKGLVSWPGSPRDNIFTVADNTGVRLSDVLGTDSPAGWTYSYASGRGSAGWQRNLESPPTDYPATMQFVGTGESTIQSPTGTRGFVLTAGATYLIGSVSKSTSGGGNNIQINYYDKNGLLISSSPPVSVNATASYAESVFPVYVPSKAVYGAVTIAVQNSATSNFTGLRVVRVPGGVSPARTASANTPTTILGPFASAIVASRTAVPYAAMMRPNAALGNWFSITVTDSKAFTIGAPVNPVTGQVITITLRNASGGGLGPSIWDRVFKMGTWMNPAPTHSRSITFGYDGTHWVELSRTISDIP